MFLTEFFITPFLSRHFSAFPLVRLSLLLLLIGKLLQLLLSSLYFSLSLSVDQFAISSALRPSQHYRRRSFRHYFRSSSLFHRFAARSQRFSRLLRRRWIALQARWTRFARTTHCSARFEGLLVAVERMLGAFERAEWRIDTAGARVENNAGYCKEQRGLMNNK